MSTTTMGWKDVLKVHRTVAGISVSQGRVASILCNSGKTGRYPDRIEANRIIYHLGGDTPQRGVAALLEMVGSPQAIRVFEKLQVDQWRDLGAWHAVDLVGPNSDGFVAVTLTRAS